MNCFYDKHIIKTKHPDFFLFISKINEKVMQRQRDKQIFTVYFLADTWREDRRFHLLPIFITGFT